MKTILLSMSDKTCQLTRSILHRDKLPDIVPALRNDYHFHQLLCRRTAHTFQNRYHSKSEHGHQIQSLRLGIDNIGSPLGMHKNKQGKDAAG